MTADLVKNAGLRCTQVRKATLFVLSQAKRPLSHQEVISHAKMRSFDRVTVYRTLEAFQKVGLAHRIQGNDGTWRFCGHQSHSASQCSGNHIHFLCANCHQMLCMPEQTLPWVVAPEGATIYSKQLLVHGLCAACHSQEREE